MQEKYSNAFLGFGPEDTNFALELTKNYGKDSYDLGTGFGHFALALPDVYKAVDSIKKAGESSQPSTTKEKVYAVRGINGVVDGRPWIDQRHVSCSFDPTGPVS